MTSKLSYQNKAEKASKVADITKEVKATKTVKEVKAAESGATEAAKKELDMIKQKMESLQGPGQVEFKEVITEPVDQALAECPVGMRSGLTVVEIPKVRALVAAGMPKAQVAKDYRITVTVLNKFL